MVCGFVEGCSCLFAGHAAQIDTANHHIIQNQAIIRWPSEEIPDTDNGTDQQNNCHTANRNQDDLAVFGQRRLFFGGLTKGSSFLFADGGFVTLRGGWNSDRLLIAGGGKIAQAIISFVKN